MSADAGEATELDDRWILPLRGSRVVSVDKGEVFSLWLDTPGEILVGYEAMFTEGPVTAPDAELTPLSSYGRSELRNLTVDTRILSAVAFKSGALRIVLDNGRHLNLRRDTSAPAVVKLGDSVIWERPTAG